MLKKINENILFFRYEKREKYKKVILTNIVGDYLILSYQEFENLINNNINRNLKNKLMHHGFWKTEKIIKKLIQIYRNKHKYLFRGPTLHIIVVTKGCNLNCIYCHSKATGLRRENFHLKQEIAEKYLKIIFSSPSPFLTIEFQGGEPTIARDIVKFIVEKTKKLAKKYNKKITFLMTTNGYKITENQIKYMLENNFKINVSIDGPEDVHNINRPAFPNKKSFNKIVDNIKIIHKLEQNFGKKLITGGICVITKYSLNYFKEIPNIYKKLKIHHILVKYIDGLGKSQKNYKIGYKIEDFIEFYKKYLEEIKNINLNGYKLIDGYTYIFLQKILGKKNPNFVDLQNPCGAAIGQVAYDRDGQIYTCDEGRTIEDGLFKLGDRRKINSINDIIQNENTAIISNCSLLESNICDRCVYQPYCGICPIHNYINFGNIFIDIRKTPRHKFNKFIQDFIFEKILTNDKNRLYIFNYWLEK